MAEEAKVPVLGLRCAVGPQRDGGGAETVFGHGSMFGWEKVYTESCTQLRKKMKKKIGVGRNSGTKMDLHVSELCAVGSSVQIGSCLWWRSTPGASRLKMMRRARESLVEYLLLFTEVRKCLPLAD